MADKQTTYTPAELRAQMDRMWLRKYPAGPKDEKWLFQVGFGAGMLGVAADRIERLEAALRSIPRYAFPGAAELWAGIDALLGETTQDREGEHG